MADTDTSPEEQIKEGIWRIATQTIVVLGSMAFGVLIGYQLWGDAPALAEQVDALTKQVQELKNDREAQAGRFSLCDRDKNEFKKRLDKCFDQKNELQGEITDLQKQISGG